MAQNEILLSIVIPITRMSGKLENLRKTLPLGGYPEFEFLLVHDKQDETTGPELLALMEELQCSNISYIESSYGSPGLARNAGLSLAKGKLIVFWDSDDIGDTRMLKEVVYSTDWNKNDAVICGFNFSHDGKLRTVRFKNDEQVNRRLLWAWPGIWRWVFKRDAIKESFHPLTMGEDILFLASNCESLNYSFRKENIYTYFIGSPTQATANLNDLKFRDLSYAESRLRELINCDNKSSRFIVGFRVAVNLTLLKYASPRAKIKPAVFVVRQLFLASQIIYFRKKIKRNKDVFVLLTGGLGNQLFQYAYLLDIVSTNKFLVSVWGKPRLNSSRRPEIASFELDSTVIIRNPRHGSALLSKCLGYCLRSGFNAHKYERRIVTAIARGITSILVTTHLQKTVFIHAQSDVGFTGQNLISTGNFQLGYFQSFQWASNPQTHDKLMSLKLCNTERTVLYQELAQRERPVIVHFRYGDYLSESDFGIPGIDYYKAALREIESSHGRDRIYWIFSDDIEKAHLMSTNLGLVNCRFFSKSELNSAETLQVMRYGYDYVIANSTFSWWGAFLTYNSEAKVIAPNPWFRGMNEPTDLIPPGWERIFSHFRAD